jgi:formate hydrogenlyase subunit 6/NADH:ubiquinone oxidoreductase subunit I
MTTGCPAIEVTDEVAKKSKKGEKIRSINTVLCTGCSVCGQFCPTDAIQLVEN